MRECPSQWIRSERAADPYWSPHGAEKDSFFCWIAWLNEVHCPSGRPSCRLVKVKKEKHWGGRPSKRAAGQQLQSDFRLFGSRPRRKLEDSNCTLRT